MRWLRGHISGAHSPKTMNHPGMVPDQWPCRIPARRFRVEGYYAGVPEARIAGGCDSRWRAGARIRKINLSATEQSESANHNDARASNHAARLVCHRVDRLRSSFADDWYGDTGPRVDAQRSLSLDARLRAGSGELASGRCAGPTYDRGGPFHGHGSQHPEQHTTPQAKTRCARQ